MNFPSKKVCPVCHARKVGLADHLKVKHGIVGPEADKMVSDALVSPAFRNTRPATPPGVHLECPDCGGKMKLRSGKYGLFYGCVEYPRCDGAHGAHPDGQPLGVPADRETRKLRQTAHAALERTWEPGPGKRFADRDHAYLWMQGALGLTSDEAHIAKFDAAQCKKLIEALWQFDESGGVT